MALLCTLLCLNRSIYMYGVTGVLSSSMHRPHRSSRASLSRPIQGEYFGTRRQQALLTGAVEFDKLAQSAQTSVSLPVILASKDVKVRKWRRALVKVGQLKIPRWIPEQANLTEELQKYKPSVAQSKKTSKRSRRRSDASSTRVQILGEIADSGDIIDMEIQDDREDDPEEEDQEDTIDQSGFARG